MDGEVHGVLYERLSRANHSCSPNMRKETLNGGSAFVYTLRDVEPGEELLVCYTPGERCTCRCNSDEITLR